MTDNWTARTIAPDTFLSAENPLATVGQRTLEDRALALLERPELKRARDIAAMLWSNVSAWPTREQADLFDGMVDEYVFHHVMRAANGDPNHPEVMRFMAPPHHWFGRDVPGSRWGGDCSDFIYRTIPIAHGGSYEIRGVQTAKTRPICFYSLMGDSTAAPQTLALLESLDMEFQPDGSFLITVDDQPANGRPNHIQTAPGSDFIMIRDAIGDWMTESANALTVRRLDPAGDPKSEDAMAAHAMKIALESVYYSFYITRMGNATPPNQVSPPQSTAAFGAVASQWGTIGRLDLAPDEAMIVRSNAAGAGFRNLQLWNLFQNTIDYWTRQSSINMAQMEPDEDGDFTYVIAHRDPGVANWLDMMGRREMLFGQRWQGFARSGEHPDPWMTTRVVRFDALEQELPDGVRRISKADRDDRLAMRKAGFGRRFLDR